jgi:hypothetical protein
MVTKSLSEPGGLLVPETSALDPSGSMSTATPESGASRLGSP